MNSPLARWWRALRRRDALPAEAERLARQPIRIVIRGGLPHAATTGELEAVRR